MGASITSSTNQTKLNTDLHYLIESSPTDTHIKHIYFSWCSNRRSVKVLAYMLNKNFTFVPPPFYFSTGVSYSSIHRPKCIFGSVMELIKCACFFKNNCCCVLPRNCAIYSQQPQKKRKPPPETHIKVSLLLLLL